MNNKSETKPSVPENSSLKGGEKSQKHGTHQPEKESDSQGIPCCG